MEFTDVLTLVGGLCLFLFGMNQMSSSLEKRAGTSLRGMIGRLTSGRIAGFLTGLVVTAVIQSSSATTVMVVGFVNSGVMTLRQAINVIMGANVGTTVTAWILSLTGIDSGSFIVQIFKPANFTPVLALIGIILVMGFRKQSRKDIGYILLGFAVLMFGMETMSSAVSGLADVPEFQNILLAFNNPVLGVLVGAVLTAIIQSSSASVGILQALSVTGEVTVGMALPIIMGQNIGTCVTAMISAVGANKNAKRAAVVHLCFNIIGCFFWLAVFYAANAIFSFSFINDSVNQATIAIIHTVFNVLCTALMLPAASLLEKLAIRLVPDKRQSKDSEVLLDERLLTTPSFAVERCRSVAGDMTLCAMGSMKKSIRCILDYSPDLANEVREEEATTDEYQDMLGTYLVKLSSHSMSEKESTETSKLLFIISDVERISDHALRMLESMEELQYRDASFSEAAQDELHVLTSAVEETMDTAYNAFTKDDLEIASSVEPLKQLVESLCDQLRARHVLRLQNGECSVDAGFVLTDILTDLERASDHCSNIAGCVLETSRGALGLHESLKEFRTDSEEYKEKYRQMEEKYALPPAKEL
ncbi:MAG: Na/Pi cotransporter family protein [Oscillospiraceae bacterium]|nr:Na/Pi cotransporter family protein [Oscillospiraceae bacterium]